MRVQPEIKEIVQRDAVLLSGSEPREGSGENELADAFLSKPVSVEELSDCLERLLAAAK